MTDYALKEWDAQVQALRSGETALLLRKGGIMETHAGFEVEHRSFFLYPTFLHQNPDELREAFRPALREDPSPGLVRLDAFAEVVGVWRVEALEAARRLEPLQALNGAAIERRFHYRNRPWLHAVLLRVVRLDEPAALPETPEMLGCVSWVPLERPLPVAGTPVLPEERLRALREEIESLLG